MIVTKQVFSQARRKVSSKAFIYLLDEVNKWFYNNTPFYTYQGYRLLAIYGTVLQLHNSDELKEILGYIENQNAKVARVKSSTLYDIENDMIISSKIAHYRTGESNSRRFYN